MPTTLFDRFEADGDARPELLAVDLADLLGGRRLLESRRLGVLGWGLPSMSDITSRSMTDRRRVAAYIADTLDRFEPRLEDVRVVPMEDTADFQFRIEAQLVDDESSSLTLRIRDARQAVTQSEFAISSSSSDGGLLAVWGRGAHSGFEGEEDALLLDGDVTTLMVASDHSNSRRLAGLVLSHSRGEGEWRHEAGETGDGEVETPMTGLYPYAAYRVTERLTLWGAGGYGEGELTLRTAHETLRTDMAMTMMAAGARSDLATAGGSRGRTLALEADGLLVRTTSDAVAGMAASETYVTRQRLRIEGSWDFVLEDGTLIAPGLEAGVRHDGGDAETGFGADIGAEFVFANPSIGLRAEVSGRMLLAHAHDDFREWGLSGTLVFDPEPASERGLVLAIRQASGSASSGGAKALFDRRTMAGLGSDDSRSGGRLNAQIDYGFATSGGGFTLTPYLGLGVADGGREWRLGWRLRSEDRDWPEFTLGMEATRSDHADAAVEHVLALRLGTAW